MGLTVEYQNYVHVQSYNRYIIDESQDLYMVTSSFSNLYKILRKVLTCYNYFDSGKVQYIYTKFWIVKKIFNNWLRSIEAKFTVKAVIDALRNITV